MSSDLSQFKNTYITECNELLLEMEERLLQLDTQQADRAELDAIFRCAHSIKGGAGAFGFTFIVQFTHIAEALLDQLRDGRLNATREVVDLLLKSKDIIATMVAAARDDAPLPAGYGDDIATALANYVSADISKRPEAQTEKTAVGAAQYQIHFLPKPSLLSTGNEPLLILRELCGLGSASVRCEHAALPVISQIDPQLCYLSWEISLHTHESEARIREVFEFVEDDCALSIRRIEEASPEKMADAAATTSTAATQEKTAASSGFSGSIRVDIEKVDKLINMVGEVIIIQAMLSAQARQLSTQEHGHLQRGIDELSQYTRELQESVMAIRMQPVKSIFSRMPRIVRDLSQQLGKSIHLHTFGETTEVDKTIIEQLSDPLTHMIRNSVDHGIESPQERLAAGKPEAGTITLSAEHRGGKIVIQVKDDGKGINRQKVLKKAIEKAVVPANATLTDEEIDRLIFAPGFSTADQVSAISGRGVGMDVVKRNIEAIGGNVVVHNFPGQGSHFTVSLPLTLAILDGMIVRVGAEYYIVPISNIIETLRPKPEDVRQIADGSNVINIRGQFVQVLYLWKLFHVKDATHEAHKGLVILVESGGRTLGLVVDELIGQQQVVIKSLESNTDPVRGVSGATILGDGKVSLILDVEGLSSHTLSTTELQAA